MKRLHRFSVAVLLCLALLCGCGADNGSADQENVSGNTPTADTQGENSTQNDDQTQSDDTDTAPDGSGDTDDSADNGEDTDPGFTVLTDEELAEWASYFTNVENNGLLRFPYADPANDPDQLAPYLGWLFYDIGEYGSEFTEEELAQLAETDLWLELDTHRLSRDYMNDYLMRKLNIPSDKTENLFDAAELGVYLLEFDAWYMSHGDTELRLYEFNNGVRLENGTVKLFYFNDFLRVVQEDGEMDYAKAQMVVTLAQREDGTWYVLSHEIEGSTWGE